MIMKEFVRCKEIERMVGEYIKGELQFQVVS